MDVGNSTLSSAMNASTVASEVAAGLDGNRQSTITVTQEADYEVTYDETLLTLEQVRQGTESVACASAGTDTCTVSYKLVRRRSLAQTASLTLSRELAPGDTVTVVPSVTSTALASTLEVDPTAVTDIVASSVRAIAVSVVLDSVLDGDPTQLKQIAATIFGIDFTALTVTLISLFPPRPPPAAPPGAPPDYLCADSCFFSNDGLCNDGSTGSIDSSCSYGTDCADCGARPNLSASPSPPPVAPINTGDSQALSSNTATSNVAWIVSISVIAGVIALLCLAALAWRWMRASKAVQPNYALPDEELNKGLYKPKDEATAGTAGAATSGIASARQPGPSSEAAASKLALQRAKRWQPSQGAKQPPPGFRLPPLSMVSQLEVEESMRSARGRPALRRCRTNPASSSVSRMDEARQPQGFITRPRECGSRPQSQELLQVGAASPPEETLPAFVRGTESRRPSPSDIDRNLEANMMAAARARTAMERVPSSPTRANRPSPLPPTRLSGAGRAAIERARQKTAEASDSSAHNSPNTRRPSSVARQPLPPLKWRDAPTPPANPSPLQHRSAPTPLGNSRNSLGRSSLGLSTVAWPQDDRSSQSSLSGAARTVAINDPGASFSRCQAGTSQSPSPPALLPRRSPAMLDTEETSLVSDTNDK